MAAILFPDDGMSYIRSDFIQTLGKSGVTSGRVLDVMSQVPRHKFVSEALRFRAYDDISLPIGYGQTLSRPSVIGKMIEACSLSGDETVLEVGTGSGYQSALLAMLCKKVVTMERIEELHLRARQVLFNSGFNNITCLHQHSFDELEQVYDVILVAAGAVDLPQVLLEILKPGGRLIIPVLDRENHQITRIYKNRDGGISREIIGTASFVPLIQ